MKILESAPSRYDRGIHILTFGKLDNAYDRFVSFIQKGHKVLDIGCGTGTLILRASRKGANTKGIDINPQMLEIAQKKVNEANLKQSVEFCEMGVAELGSEESESYDVVMSSLCFSELSEDELTYTLKEVNRILKPEGLLLIADEVKSKSLSKRILNWFVRIPFIVITYLSTQTTTNAVENLPAKVKETGLKIESIRYNKMQNFIELVAMKK